MLLTSSNFINKPLTKDEMRAKAPIIFASEPTRKVSGQYVFANTETVLDDMATLGWNPVQVAQRTPRKDSVTTFSPHMVKFVNPDIKISGKNGDDSFPQIILQNRHDGLGAFRFMAGIYRLVCSNGLVIATAEFASVAIAHKGYSFDELRDTVRKRVEVLPEQVEIMNQMQDVNMSKAEQRKLALDSLLIRSGINPTSDDASKFEYDGATIEEILQPRRKEDEGNDLWRTFNRVQESMVKGGVKVGRRVSKSIASFEKDLDLNQKLFTRAMEYIPV